MCCHNYGGPCIDNKKKKFLKNCKATEEPFKIN